MVLDQDLVDAATFGDVELVADWLQSLDRSEDINEVDARGRTVLNLCAKGYDNHYNDDGDGPSILVEQTITAVQMILAKGGADVNLADKHGWTPQFLACKALIKKARSEPRKTVLALRALAIKGRAKTADPVLKFLVDTPDGLRAVVRGAPAREELPGGP